MKSVGATSYLKKNTMLIALVVVIIFFSIVTQGKILYAQNINNLISQNGYVFVLAAGMLLCILTGGNIDLAVGSVVCLACCIGANLIVTPIYMGTPTEKVVEMIVPALLPFNLAKIAINCVVTALVYKPVTKALGN